MMSVTMLSRDVGHTLLEFVVALAIGVLASIAIVNLVQSAFRVQQRHIDDAHMQLAGLAALDSARAYLRLAGYGEHLQSVSERAGNAAAFTGCGARSGGGERWCERVDSPTQAVVARYRADVVSAWLGTTRMPLDCTGETTGHASIIAHARLTVHGNDSQRYLYCSVSALGQGASLVGGIDVLSIRYRRLGSSGFVEAEAVPADRWKEVDAVRFCALASGRTVGLAAPYRGCDGTWQPAARDGRQRKAFQTTALLRNTTALGVSDTVASGRHAPRF